MQENVKGLYGETAPRKKILEVQWLLPSHSKLENTKRQILFANNLFNFFSNKAVERMVFPIEWEYCRN